MRLAFLFLFPILANAYPGLNDVAKYDTVIVYNTVNSYQPPPAIGTTTITITQVLDWFATSEKWEGDTLPPFLEHSGIDRFPRWGTTVDDVLANCATKFGTLKTITVPAGTFQTCAVNIGNGITTYIGQVPTGVVQYVDVQGYGTMVGRLLPAGGTSVVRRSTVK